MQMQHMKCWTALLGLSNINDVIDVSQVTAKHLSCDLMFVVSDKMTFCDQFVGQFDTLENS